MATEEAAAPEAAAPEAAAPEVAAPEAAAPEAAAPEAAAPEAAAPITASEAHHDDDETLSQEAAKSKTSSALLKLYDRLLTIFGAVMVSKIANNLLELIDFSASLALQPLAHLCVAAGLIIYANFTYSINRRCSRRPPQFLVTLVGHTSGWQVLSFWKASACGIAYYGFSTPGTYWPYDHIQYRALLANVVVIASVAVQW